MKKLTLCVEEMRIRNKLLFKAALSIFLIASLTFEPQIFAAEDNQSTNVPLKTDVKRLKVVEEVIESFKGDLSEMNLQDVDLSETDLSGADLEHAYLHGSNLSGANLSGANLHGANLSGADLEHAYLHGANLSGANLSGIHNLDQGQLDGACVDEKTRLPEGFTIGHIPQTQERCAKLWR